VIGATFRAMGCDVVVRGASEPERAAIEELFIERDHRFSRFRSDSELTRVNTLSARVQVVSDDFAAMTRLALRATRATDGLVDPTVGAAIVALGYDRDFEDLEPDRTDARPVPAGRHHEVRVYGRLLDRAPGIQLDLNGVVKSRTVDDALALMGGAGFVSAGGDLATRGPIDVALPDGDAVRLQGGALATSGTLTRSWLRGDERVHHLVDPATGRSANSPWYCVTVAAASCLRADVAAKAAFLLGEYGPDWLEEHSLPGRFVGRAGVIVETPGWARQTRGLLPTAA
jgi:thiamine biosynthesis lipoprotein